MSNDTIGFSISHWGLFHGYYSAHFHQGYGWGWTEFTRTDETGNPLRQLSPSEFNDAARRSMAGYDRNAAA